jgi:GNAT superfamily N-acetyltransferase
MMTNEVRKATLSDLTILSKRFDDYRIFYGKDSNLREANDFLRDRISNGDSQIFVAHNEETITGFVQLYPLFSSTRMKKLWLLNDLFVDPTYRGQGISILLIDRAKELCRETGACGMYLETAKTNTIGNQLYPTAGFVLNDAHHFYDWSV